MVSWSARKKLKYTGWFLLLAAVVVGTAVFFLVYDEPTCFDGKRNGDEAGIDCGGSCPTLCQFQSKDPVLIWDEAFEVRLGSWTAVAYLENPNSAVASQVAYSFKLLDDKGILVAERTGEVFIPEKKRFAVVETDIDVGNRRPVQEFFEITDSDIEWLTRLSSEPNLEIKDPQIEESRLAVKLEAVIENPNTFLVEDVEIVGILYDIDGNVLAASKSTLREIPASSESSVIFTWPRTFERPVARREILYKVTNLE